MTTEPSGTAKTDVTEETDADGQIIGTAGVVALLLFLRILAVSHWDWAVASKVAATFEFSDAASIALGTLFEWPTLTAIVTCVVMPVVILRLYLNRKRPLGAQSLVAWLIVVTFLAALIVLVRSFSMWWPIVAVVVLTIAVLSMAMLYHHGRVHRWLEIVKRGAGLIAALGILVLATFVDTPWMPREEITLKSGSVVEGYVLEDAPGFVTVLTDDHQVDIYSDAEIVARK